MDKQPIESKAFAVNENITRRVNIKPEDVRPRVLQFFEHYKKILKNELWPGQKMYDGSYVDVVLTKNGGFTASYGIEDGQGGIINESIVGTDGEIIENGEIASIAGTIAVEGARLGIVRRVVTDPDGNNAIGYKVYVATQEHFRVAENYFLGVTKKGAND